MGLECIAESSVPSLGQPILGLNQSVSQSVSHWGLEVESSASALVKHRKIHSSFLTPTFTAPLSSLSRTFLQV